MAKKQAADLRAATWATLGNVKRMASDFPGASDAFNRAWKIHEEEGTGTSIAAAVMVSYEASYLVDMGHFEAAEAALAEVRDTYREQGDRHQECRTLIEMGHAIGFVDPWRGIEHLTQGLELLDPSREPRLELCAVHALAHFYAHRRSAG